ncbi:hypothetical protein [Microbacterium sp. Leaf320]|uniref:hypothetical protein n=1 Tax=Microbacterium sp. Leaf320 TaxID=1736334 RepID=UPI0006F1ED2F|nr:hypothetical protein [Microbacterium sp. Leaf320]KQQ65691.1 hypothetical protein ASF63_10035 [Microbacterium sp. Leaf320]
MSTPTETPNVVVQNPTVRKTAGIVLGAVGIALGTVVVVDGAAPAFDLTEYTGPITAGYLYLSSLFGLAVTVPNVPASPRSLLRRDLR